MARPQRAKVKREPVFLRVVKGGFEPASEHYAAMLRAKGFRVGDLVRAELTKPRNPRHHRLVFATLQRVLDNLDTAMTVEQLLTILKIKLGRAVPYVDSGTGRTYWVPESLAFDAMDESEFSVFHRDMCRVIARDYFPSWTPEQVAELAEMMEET